MNATRPYSLVATAALLAATLNTVAQDAAAEQPPVQLRDLVVSTQQETRNPLSQLSVEPIGLDIATSTVGQDDIQRMRPITVTDALELAPGAWTETRGRKVKQFTSFRGQTYPYPDYALDGLWLRDFHELPYFLPAAELESITVVRSSAALLTGNSGLAGVIDLVPKRYVARNSYAELEAGEDNSLRGYISHYEPTGRGGVYVGVGHYQTDGHKEFGAERHNTLTLRFDQQLSDHFQLDALLLALDGERELVQAEPPAGKRFQTEQEKFDPIRSLVGSLRLRYQHNERATTELAVWGVDRQMAYSRFTPSTAKTSTHDDDDYEYGIQLLQAVALSDNNILRLSGLYHHWVVPDGKRYYTGRRTDSHTLAATVVDEHTIGALTLDGGIRISREYIDEFGAFSIEGSGSKFKETDPIVEEWAEPLVRLNVGGRYAMDVAGMLYANYAFGQVDPRRGSLTENDETPLSEKRHSLDVGWQAECRVAGMFKFGGFYTLREDALLLTGNTYAAPGELELEYYANRDLEQYGLELEYRSHPLWNCAVLFADALLMDSRVTTANGSSVDYKEVPDEIASAGIYMDVAGVDLNLFARYVGSYENQRFAADKKPKPLGDYTDINLTAGVRLGAEKRTRVYAKINNLLDETYSTVVGYPDAGRLFSAGIQHTF
jgi:outer membrane receptor protein involved in Fe transport